jgi:hypothetical protein
VLQRAGQSANIPVPPRAQGYGDPKITYHEPLAQYEPKALLSAPVGHHGILDEVRAAPRTRTHRHTHRRGHRDKHLPSSVVHSNRPSHGSRSDYTSTSAGQISRSYTSQSSTGLSASLTSGAGESTPEQTPTLATVPIPISGARRLATTMSRGNILGRSAKVEPLTWLSSVRVSERPRDGGSSGTGSGQNSGPTSRIGSRSRPQSREPAVRRRSNSRSRWMEGEDTEGQSLQDEYVHRSSCKHVPILSRITTVLHRLASSKVKLEKVKLLHL